MKIRRLFIFILSLAPFFGIAQNTVEWINLVNLTLSGDTLEKTSGTVGWNAYANSTNILVGDGWVKYNVATLGTQRLFGFSQQGVTITSDVQVIYGFYVNGTDLYSRESGTQTYLNTTYAIGDELLIERIGNTIYYKKDSVVLRQITVDGTLQLNAAAVFRNQGTKLEAVTASFDSTVPLNLTATWNHVFQIPQSGSIDITPNGGNPPYSFSWTPGGDTTEDLTNLSPGVYTVMITDSNLNTYEKSFSIGYGVEWIDMIGTDTIADVLQKTSTAGGWLAGAASRNILKSTEDGWVEYKVLETNKTKVFGLSSYPNTSETLNTIKYGYQIRTDGYVYIYELGVPVLQTIQYTLGDVLKIERLGGFINYYQNGLLKRQVATDDSLQLIVDVSFNTNSGKFQGVATSFSAPPSLSFSVTQVALDSSVLGSIDLSVTSGVPPYTYYWQPIGATTQDLTGLSPNTYSVIVTDATGRKTEGAIGVGYNMEWKELVNVTVTGNTIEKTSGAAGWNAGAASVDILPSAVDGWIEYNIETSNTYRIIGFSKLPSNQLSTLTGINYGFQIRLDGQIIIYELGVGKYTIPKYYQGDVLRIERKSNQINYLVNNNIVRSVVVDSLDSLYADISLQTIGSKFEDVRYLFSAPYISALDVEYTVNNESVSSLGSISLDVSGGVQPYYYFWEDGNRTKNRYNLESGIYNVSIVDTTFLDTINLSIPIYVEMEVLNATGLDITSNEITKSGVDGWQTGTATLKNIVNGDGQISVEINDTVTEFTYGLRSITNTTATIYQEFDYAFYVDVNNQLYAWDNNQLTALGTINQGDVLTIKKEDTNILFQQNNNTLRQVPDSSSNIYLIDFSLYSSGMRLAQIGIGGWTIVPRINSTITHVKSCGAEGGSIDLTLKGGIPPYTYAWSNGATTQDVTNLQAGIYTVTISQNSAIGVPITKTYEIGYEVIWKDLIGIVANDNSISATTNSSLHSTRSTNSISGDQKGWVEFNIPVIPFSGNFNDYPNWEIDEVVNYGHFAVGSINPYINFPETPFNIAFDFEARRIIRNFTTTNSNFIDYVINEYKIYFYTDFNNFGYHEEAFISTDRIKIEWIPNNLSPNNSVVNYYKNNNLIFSSNSISIDIVSDFFLMVNLEDNYSYITLTENSSLANVVTSFGCPTLNPVYTQQATLKKKLDGGFYVTDNGHLFFQYNELYNNGSLNYKIYNSLGTVVLDGIQLPQTKKFGLNKYQLNLNFRTEFTPEEFYVLEVINDKNQSEFLRFKF